MQSLKKIIFTLFCSTIAVAGVNAASSCPASEIVDLNREAVNIKVTHEEAEGVLDPSEYLTPPMFDNGESDSTYTYFKVSILNMTDHFYVEVTNDYDDQKRTFRYSDAVDGVITFNWENLDAVSNWTITVYSTENTGCPGESFRTIKYTLPRENEYYNYAMCSEAPDYYLCEKYVTVDTVDYYTFVDNVTKYIERQAGKPIDEIDNDDKNIFEKAGNFIADHKVVFITAGIAIVVVAGVAVAVIIKKRRSSEI